MLKAAFAFTALALVTLAPSPVKTDDFSGILSDVYLPKDLPMTGSLQQEFTPGQAYERYPELHLPHPEELLAMLAEGYGCRFSIVFENTLECPVSVAPANVYSTGSYRTRYLHSDTVMEKAQHSLIIEKLEGEALPYVAPVEFGEPRKWVSHDGSRNLEVYFRSEGVPYRLRFRLYDYGVET